MMSTSVSSFQWNLKTDIFARSYIQTCNLHKLIAVLRIIITFNCIVTLKLVWTTRLVSATRLKLHHSTETAVVKVNNDIVLAIDADFITAPYFFLISVQLSTASTMPSSYTDSPTSIWHNIYSSTLDILHSFPIACIKCALASNCN